MGVKVRPSVNYKKRPGDTDRLGVGTRILTDSEGKWRFDRFSQYADKNGVWEWTEAPLDEFQAAICRPDGMQLSRHGFFLL